MPHNRVGEPLAMATGPEVHDLHQNSPLPGTVSSHLGGSAQLKKGPVTMVHEKAGILNKNIPQ